MTIIHRIRTLVIKELRVLLADPQGRRLLLMPVILQIALFPLAATLEVKNNTLAVLNQDSGAISGELLQRFAASQAFTHFIYLENEAQMKEVVDSQKALIVLHFPLDFSRRFLSGQGATLQALLDGRRSTSGQIALGYLQETLNTYLSEVRAQAGQAALSEIVVRHWFNPNLDYVDFIMPNLVAQILLLGCLIVTSLSVAREREQGTLDQLLVSPLTPEMIMIGKAIPAMLIAIFQATIVLSAAVLIYQVPFKGSLLLFYGSMLFYVISLVGFGLLISSVCANQQQAFLGVFCFLMPTTLLSGLTSPIDNMPHWLQTLTWFNPLRHFMTISRGIFLKDAGIDFVLIHLAPLLLIGAMTLSGAIWMFRRKSS